MAATDYTSHHHSRGIPWGPKFEGPYPITVSRMARSVLENITVHLANEHKVNSDPVPFEQRQLVHALAHMYGEFRPGQEHYHEKTN